MNHIQATPPTAPAEKSSLAKFIHTLCLPEIFFWATLWLIVLLVVGTVAQSKIGLYLSQEKYFSSWFFLFGPVPLPGGRLTMLVIFINLLAKLIFESPWEIAKMGVIITHVGALVLLAGGFITAYFSIEGSMVIPEGQSSYYFESYETKELAIINATDPNLEKITAISGKRINTGSVISGVSFPGQITVHKYFTNCSVEPRTGNPENRKLQGVAQRFTLQERPFNKEVERNRAGMYLEISGLEDSVNGFYAIFQQMSVEQTVFTQGEIYRLVVRRQRYSLPFQIELIDFRKEMHPGTRMPKSYESEVYVLEGDTKRRVLIEMNEPLRYMNYTFYQSSFIEDGPNQSTVLAVVRNAGRLFPYISSMVICFGVLVHMIIKLPILIRRSNVGKNG